MLEYISKIDSLRFGFSIAKVNNYTESPGSIVSKSKDAGVKLIMSRISTVDTELINKLEILGFVTKDIQLTYGFDYEIENKLPALPENDFIIREVRQGDEQKISSLAKQAFNNYGHYFADEKLDKEKCGLIYEEWALNSCLDKTVADHMIVAEQSGEILGFLSFKRNTTNNTPIMEGGLGAVSAHARSKGVFRAINIAGLHWAATENVISMQHNVLVTNLPVNKTYARLGFTIVRSEITLHKWL